MYQKAKLKPGAVRDLMNEIAAMRPLQPSPEAEQRRIQQEKEREQQRIEQEKQQRADYIKAEYKAKYLNNSPMTEQQFELLWEKSLRDEAFRLESEGKLTQLGWSEGAKAFYSDF